MNQMLYPFMPDINPNTILFHHDKIMELEKRINMLEVKINKLTHNSVDTKTKPLISTEKDSLDGVFMV